MTYVPVTHCIVCGMALRRECDRRCPWCQRRAESLFFAQWEAGVIERRPVGEVRSAESEQERAA